MRILLSFIIFTLAASLFALDTSLLMQGSWAWDKKMENRLDGSLEMSGIKGRLLLNDARPSAFWEKTTWESGAGQSGLGLGLYHRGSGSRLLYGALNNAGLPARLANPFSGNVHWASSYKATESELKKEASRKETEIYGLFSSPWWTLPQDIKIMGFAQIQTEFEQRISYDAGSELIFSDAKGRRQHLGIEFFNQFSTLEALKATGWFSKTYPLPQRRSNIYGGHAFYLFPGLEIQADGAISETEFWGRGCFGSTAVEFNSKLAPFIPWNWKLHLAIEGINDHFTDAKGKSGKGGIRGGLKYEHLLKKSETYRADIQFHWKANEDSLKIKTNAVYRFPSNVYLGLFHPVQIGLSYDSGTEAKEQSTIAGHFNFLIKPLSTKLYAAYAPAFESPSSEKGFFKTGCNLKLNLKPLYLTFGTGYHTKDGVDTSLGITYKKPHWTLGAKAGCNWPLEGTTPKWSVNLNWRVVM
ncbi:MAG: hypothetical protein LBM77_10330 [Spirochaetaceae bacterium]|jgi:hypothetical protein|nr:hypothetical protein [Spirochaetaceae bacterium]